jgi:hypothetical protein
MSDTNKLSWKTGDTLVVHLKAQEDRGSTEAFWGIDDDGDDYYIATSNVKAAIPQPEVWNVGDKFKYTKDSVGTWTIVGVVGDDLYAIGYSDRYAAPRFSATRMVGMVRA